MQLGCLRRRELRSRTRFLVDECVGRRFHELLVAEGFESVYVGDWKAGASDEEIVEKSISDQSIILTEDKDFGELVVRRSLRPRARILSSPSNFRHTLHSFSNYLI